MTRILFLLAIISGSAAAECDLSGLDFDAMRKAHDSFKTAPGEKSAVVFLESIPDQFCQFNEAYGYVRKKGAGPLYGLELDSTLPELPKYIEAEKIAEKYVALASEASWDADSVNFLQNSYRELIISNPEAVLKRLASLSKERRNTAIIFLFDGPHPGNAGFDEEELNKLCSVNKEICEEIKLTFSELAKDDHGH